MRMLLKHSSEVIFATYLVNGQKQNSCADVIVGYNNTRVQYSVNPQNGDIEIVYGYNLFYPNGPWTDVDNQFNQINGAYYLDGEYLNSKRKDVVDEIACDILLGKLYKLVFNLD